METITHLVYTYTFTSALGSQTLPENRTWLIIKLSSHHGYFIDLLLLDLNVEDYSDRIELSPPAGYLYKLWR